VSTSSPATSDRVATILEAACRVVAREGAHGLRMASVAQDAGVSKALVHYYFSTRQELLRHTFAFAESRRRQALERDLEELATGAERLRHTLLAQWGGRTPFTEHSMLFNEVWSSLRFDGELRPLVETSYREWIAWLEAVIGAGKTDGSIAPSVDAAGTARRLAALADGVDSMVYAGALDTGEAIELVAGAIAREVSGA
jgi:AcrR family transcriptional regulator